MKARSRLEAIEDYEVLDGRASKELDGVVSLAARLCGVPMAAISILTEREQCLIAATGVDAGTTPGEESMCMAVLHERGTVVVPDARQDPRFRDLPHVGGPDADVRFYASHALVTPDDVVIGRLCVFDKVTRELDDLQLTALGGLAERVVDILELALRGRQLEDTLRHLEGTRADLEAANQRLSAFAAQVTHDLKSPLSSVAMSLDLIGHEVSVGYDRRQVEWFVAKARAGAERMETLIDDLLAYATQGGQIVPRVVDLDLALATVLDDLEGMTRNTTVLPARLPTVMGDEVKLRSLLQNLVSNAVKFARPEVPGVVRVGATRHDGTWRIEVVDNGRGLGGVADPESLFEPLVRGDLTVPGAGIGLATCRSIVEAHGGSIGLHESLEGGTTAWFELPA